LADHLACEIAHAAKCSSAVAGPGVGFGNGLLAIVGAAFAASGIGSIEGAATHRCHGVLHGIGAITADLRAKVVSHQEASVGVRVLGLGEGKLCAAIALVGFAFCDGDALLFAHGLPVSGGLECA